MKDFIKGLFIGFCGFWTAYFAFMFVVNFILWICWDESEVFYQPVWNIFKLM